MQLKESVQVFPNFIFIYIIKFIVWILIKEASKKQQYFILQL